MRVTIPWQHLASSNERNTRRGGKAHSYGYKQAREAIHLHALDQHRSNRPEHPEGRVSVRIDYYPPDFRRRDCGNLNKVLLDGLQGVAYEDDWQVCDLRWLRRDPDADDPRAEVRVEAA